MTSKEINIWGSCVSRDAVEFADGLRMGMYCARQSVVSSVAAPVSPATFKALEFKEATHAFHRRLVEEDFLKISLSRLNEQHQEGALIFDLIEERVPIGVTTCGTLVTYSQAASGFSNARSLIKRLIQPYSDEHVALFGQAITEFAARLSDRTVIIHKALYAEGDWEFQTANRVLSDFYEMAIRSFSASIVIEVEPGLRASTPNHKWGVAPYHYTDGYYQNFVEQLALRASLPASVKPAFTLQKAL